MRFRIATYIVLSALFLTVFSGCDKDENTVPVAFVDLEVDLSLPDFIPLKSIGGWVYISGGQRGIILYRASLTEYNAYERLCTYDPTESCSTVDVGAANIKILDNDCCGSEFSLINGAAIQGPAVLELTRYSTDLDGNILYITN